MRERWTNQFATNTNLFLIDNLLFLKITFSNVILIRNEEKKIIKLKIVRFYETHGQIMFWLFSRFPYETIKIKKKNAIIL